MKRQSPNSSFFKALTIILFSIAIPLLLMFVVPVPLRYFEIILISSIFVGAFLASSFKLVFGIGLVFWFLSLLMWSNLTYSSASAINIISNRLSPSNQSHLIRSLSIEIYPLEIFLLSGISGASLGKAVRKVIRKPTPYTDKKLSRSEREKISSATAEMPTTVVNIESKAPSEITKVDIKSANFQCNCGELFLTISEAEHHLEQNPKHKVHKLGFKTN